MYAHVSNRESLCMLKERHPAYVCHPTIRRYGLYASAKMAMAPAITKPIGELVAAAPVKPGALEEVVEGVVEVDFVTGGAVVVGGARVEEMMTGVLLVM